MKTNTKKITVLAMLSAMAFIVMAVFRIPVVLFLKYDPKDVMITIGGFLYGPLSAAAVSAVVSTIEMLTISDTGPVGALMNMIQSCSFACTAAFVYKRRHSLNGAVCGLAAGWILTVAVMLLWNYLITPLYMGVPRAEVAKLLIPAFLPFNLLKGGLNAALTMLLYKSARKALVSSRLMPPYEGAAAKGKINIGVLVAAAFVLVTCALWVLVLQGKL